MFDHAVTPEPVEATTAKVSPGPPSARWTSKPVSFDEVSCQERSIRVGEDATALVFEGGFTPAVAANTGSRETISETIAALVRVLLMTVPPRSTLQTTFGNRTSRHPSRPAHTGRQRDGATVALHAALPR